jgi:hypothetical protein
MQYITSAIYIPQVGGLIVKDFVGTVVCNHSGLHVLRNLKFLKKVKLFLYFIKGIMHKHYTGNQYIP